jgi:enterochelin esterase-like enzyme
MIGLLRARLAGALCLSFAFASAPLAGPAPASGGRRGVVLRLEIPAPSLGGGERRAQVYLPPSYLAPDSARRDFPVVYLLHGWPGSEGNWMGMGRAAATADSLIERGIIPDIVLVSPNASGPGFFGRSLYLDSFDGSLRMEDFVVRDVVGWTDRRFRTRRDPRDRALIGLSDGANGAFDLAFRHPDVFGACGGHSGQYRLTPDWSMRHVLGPEPGASRLLDAHSPALLVDSLAAKLRGLTIYFDIGAKDENLQDNRAFDRKLTALGVPHTYREFPGTHDWTYWRTHLRESLIAVTRPMR